MLALRLISRRRGDKMARIIWGMMMREEITAWRDRLPPPGGNAVSAWGYGHSKEID